MLLNIKSNNCAVLLDIEGKCRKIKMGWQGGKDREKRQNFIDSMKFGKESSLFGLEKDDSFKAGDTGKAT
jgi:hypothetical protein